MNVNLKQRRVLRTCAFAVIAMLLYPPLHVRGLGRGYGWIFRIEEPLTINASQLVVQWISVGIVGCIAFVLAAGQDTPPALTRRPSLAQVMFRAFRASKPWLWVLFTLVVVKVLMSSDDGNATVNGIGTAGAAIVIYVLIFLWNCFDSGPGVFDAPTSTKQDLVTQNQQGIYERSRAAGARLRQWLRELRRNA